MSFDQLQKDALAQRRIKIAYLCDADPRDRNLYSGGNARIYDALCTQFPEVIILPQDWGVLEGLRKLLLRMPEPIILRAKWRLHLLLAPIIALRLRRLLRTLDVDVVFGAYSFHSFHCLKLGADVVSVYTSDASPSTYKNSEVGQVFDSYLKVSRLFDGLVQRAERKVFNSIDLLLWPSDWIRRNAGEMFGLSEAHSLTVPWGANVPDPGDEPGPALAPEGRVNILFVGRDWFAKGGSVTAEAVHELRRRGVDAHLKVIGCVPPELDLGEALEVVPSLDKAKPEELAQFNAAFRQAHFLMMPSFESYGFAYCEASAFGLPAICLDVGGIPVRDGVNGVLLTPDSPASAFADVVQRYMASPKRYAVLRQDTRQEYEAHLNWAAWAEKTALLIQQAVQSKSRKVGVATPRGGITD